MPVGVGVERRAIEDGADESALNVFLAPGVGDDVVVIEIAVLRDITGHPVSRALEYEKIEDAIVDRSTTFGFPAQIEVAEALGKLGNKSGLSRVIVEPGFQIEEVARACRFDRAGVPVIKHRRPIPVSEFTASIE